MIDMVKFFRKESKMSKISSDELKELLAYATGTENYWTHNLFGRKMLITDGVKLFADKAEAYWFLDEILLNKTSFMNKAPNEYFFSIILKSKNSRAQILFTDGNGNKVLEKRIKFTDCPEGDWKFFYDIESNVMLLPSEY